MFYAARIGLRIKHATTCRRQTINLELIIPPDEQFDKEIGLLRNQMKPKLFHNTEEVESELVGRG